MNSIRSTPEVSSRCFDEFDVAAMVGVRSIEGNVGEKLLDDVADSRPVEVPQVFHQMTVMLLRLQA